MHVYNLEWINKPTHVQWSHEKQTSFFPTFKMGERKYVHLFFIYLFYFSCIFFSHHISFFFFFFFEKRSNGKFRSTLHRVLPAVGADRISIPFFFEPNLDTVVTPLDFVHTHNSAHVDKNPIMFADHLYKKVSNNFSFYSWKKKMIEAGRPQGKIMSVFHSSFDRD